MDDTQCTVRKVVVQLWISEGRVRSNFAVMRGWIDIM